MAVTLDGSTPVRWSTTLNTSGSSASASFTAPANALLVACFNYDADAVASAFTVNCSDSGGLTWSRQVERHRNETTTGGGSAIFTARTTSATSRTVSIVRGSDGDGNFRRVSGFVYVLTGVDVDGTPVDSVGANNEGGSSTNNLTTSNLTAGAAGMLICCDTDWSQLGVFTSSDLTIDTADYSGTISVMSGYKAVSAGTVNGNLNAGGTGSAQHKWCQIVVREAAVVAPIILPPFPWLPRSILAQ